MLGWTQCDDGMEHAWSPGAPRQDDAPAAPGGGVVAPAPWAAVVRGRTRDPGV
ncbi:hypothetical protein [Phycicoccus avicenniae]|uniref:hypothetical protein n=1 Tax=Phycicoccus avicenniae TaxID=2828860 RepID=UPI003D2D4D32